MEYNNYAEFLFQKFKQMLILTFSEEDKKIFKLDEKVLAIGFEKGVEFCFRDLNENGKIKGVNYGNKRN